MGEREEVEALAEVLNPMLGLVYALGWSAVEGADFLTQTAAAVLASDWLAAHDERIRADERERLAGEVERG